MANILIRGLDEDVVALLKVAATSRGHSLQAEIRETLIGASLRSLAETRRLSAKWLDELADSDLLDTPLGEQLAEPEP
jgi:plasmid stability protein